MKNTTGSRLRKIRLDADLRLEAFAAELEMSPTTYTKYEYGDHEIPSRLLLALFHKFGVDPIWLLTGGCALLGSSATRPIARSRSGEREAKKLAKHLQ